MSTPENAPEKARPNRDREFQDCHYHDDDDDVPVDDVMPRRSPNPVRRRLPRRPQPRRRDYED